MKYQKKPIVVEAFQVTLGSMHTEDTWPEWLKKASKKNMDKIGGFVWLKRMESGYIRTLEGPLSVRLDDWIIKGIQGELYPCKPDIFSATYEPVKT